MSRRVGGNLGGTGKGHSARNFPPPSRDISARRSGSKRRQASCQNSCRRQSTNPRRTRLVPRCGRACYALSNDRASVPRDRRWMNRWTRALAVTLTFGVISAANHVHAEMSNAQRARAEARLIREAKALFTLVLTENLSNAANLHSHWNLSKFVSSIWRGTQLQPLPKSPHRTRLENPRCLIGNAQ